jgi:tetratricopeptide (TPR) repeat protein
MRLALYLSLPLVAWAQSSLDPDTEIARRHFEAGRLKYEASDYLGALDEFEAAGRVRQFAAFDYNIARCLDRLERPAEAIAAYERYLGQVGDQPDAEEVRERVRVLKQRIAAPAAPRPPPIAAVEKPRPRRPWIVPSVIAGGAVAAAAVGAGLLGSVQVDYDRMAYGSTSCRPCSASQVAPLRARAIAGEVLLGAAGALAVIDVILWVRARRR